MCDTSTWDAARPAPTSTASASHGHSPIYEGTGVRAVAAAPHVLEAAADALALSDALGWSRFVVERFLSASVHSDGRGGTEITTPSAP
jgi:hypothetical protein